MITDRKEAYSEVLQVLRFVEDSYVEKIPKKLIKFFEDNCEKEYNFEINPELPLEEQNLKKETVTLLAILDLNYWATPEHKEELMKQYNENEKKFQKELLEKYNPNEIFQDTQKQEIQNDIVEEKAFDNENSEQSLTVIEKENFFKSLLRKIQTKFKKKEKN